MNYTLRPYQTECLDAVHMAFRSHDCALVVMATGLGKTVLFSHIASDWKQGRILVVAHREELIQQAREKLLSITPYPVGVEMAEAKAAGEKVIVSSIQTLSRERRLCRFEADDFGLVIIDEAHHAVADTYLRVIDHFRQNTGCKLLGVTATPKRADELAMGQVFSTVAFDYGIEPASADGWLVPVAQQAVKVEGLDFSACRTTAGDFNEGDLEKIIADEQMLHKVAAPTVDLAGKRPTLVFCVTVDHAERMAAVLRRYTSDSAAQVVSGKTPRDRRSQTVADFKAGRIQFLCNVGVFLEGFDAPNCACIAMARPTKSLGLYTQVIGRGTRSLPGVIDGLEFATPTQRLAAIAASLKPDLLVLDYVGNSGRHKIITLADLLGGKYKSAVKDYARRTAEEEGKPELIGQALFRAESEMSLDEQHEEMVDQHERAELERRRREEVRRHITAESNHSIRNVSLYNGTAPAPAVASRRVARMPFGKHKGTPISEISTGYLEWVLGLKVKEWLRNAAQEEIARRKGGQS